MDAKISDGLDPNNDAIDYLFEKLMKAPSITRSEYNSKTAVILPHIDRHFWEEDGQALDKEREQLAQKKQRLEKLSQELEAEKNRLDEEERLQKLEQQRQAQINSETSNRYPAHLSLFGVRKNKATSPRVVDALKQMQTNETLKKTVPLENQEVASLLF